MSEKTYTILSACGSGVATSSHIAASLTSSLKEMGVSVNVRTCSLGEIDGLVESMHPSIVVATASLETVHNWGEIKVMNGIPLLTGVGRQEKLNEIAEYLKSQ